MRFGIAVAALTLVGAASLAAGPSLAQQEAVRDGLRAAPQGQSSGMQAAPKPAATAGAVALERVPTSQMQSSKFSPNSSALSSASEK